MRARLVFPTGEEWMLRELCVYPSAYASNGWNFAARLGNGRRHKISGTCTHVMDRLELLIVLRTWPLQRKPAYSDGRLRLMEDYVPLIEEAI